MYENPWAQTASPIAVPCGPAFPVAMVTGHRPKLLTPAEVAWSQAALMNVAWRLRSVYGTVRGLSGFALGADTWWALGVLACGMSLEAHIPFEDQPSGWGEVDRHLWSELRARAASETVAGGKAYDVKMLHARNDAMLDATRDGSGVVVVLYKPGTPGGTRSVVDKADKMGLPQLLLDPGTRTVTRRGW